MSHRLLEALLLAAAAIGTTAATGAQAQTKPLIYIVHNAPRPGCPGLVLHFRVADKSIAGFASYYDMKGVSRIAGTRNGVGHFEMTLDPIDPTGPKGTIVGDARTDNAEIRSVLKGEGCNDGPLRIRTIRITDAK
jgi:hypothetical protein